MVASDEATADFDDGPVTDEELDRLARHAGMHDEPHLPHPIDGRHPLCDWCQYPHIRACRLIAALRAARAEVERLEDERDAIALSLRIAVGAEE
jgi:hypothetical protein